MQFCFGVVGLPTLEEKLNPVIVEVPFAFHLALSVVAPVVVELLSIPAFLTLVGFV